MIPDIDSKILTILSETTGLAVEDFLANPSLVQTGVDSLDRVEIVMACEDEFGVDMGDIVAFSSVEDLVALVKGKLQ